MEFLLLLLSSPSFVSPRRSLRRVTGATLLWLCCPQNHPNSRSRRSPTAASPWQEIPQVHNNPAPSCHIQGSRNHLQGEQKGWRLTLLNPSEFCSAVFTRIDFPSLRMSFRSIYVVLFLSLPTWWFKIMLFRALFNNMMVFSKLTT